MHITGGRGVSRIYDPVGGKSLERLVQAAAVGAKIIEYGLLATKPTVLPLFEALVKFLTIKAYDVHEIFHMPEQMEIAREYILQRLNDGSYTPHIGKTFPLDEIVKARQYMETNAHVGKIVVVV